MAYVARGKLLEGQGRLIGEALYISFNTIKTHVKSIFRKLDVATRPDAVSRARELKLL